ncbi:membrane protein CcdC involved in cytochrome C biogenesis [Paenibacillus phyllosphaerae]|uniref:Membrane protein CcdC involved in cytochrome C biogenesis n=1 Tax=Paenibacillus phyllosphaerae TaxID=274593 RepID=A0A7W5B3G0_9BACL|nr:CcdC protein domain-containing protein [Paenibacillus phyllosphaerae]MBB3113537.1 membrane protein CcdC involved in cytochrome C biogenesis [Paenibacillus phyllosphaerae]
MNWFRRQDRPIKRDGIGILVPVLLLPILFAFTLYQLRHLPDLPFILPAIWEVTVAAALGLMFGTVMLIHTAYEKREDGHVYPTRNKNFKYILIAIIVIRFALTEYLRDIDQTVLTVLAMVLALTYVCVWRIGSYMKYKAATKLELAPVEPAIEEEQSA